LWHNGQELRNDMEKCGKALKPDDTLRITFDDSGIYIAGATAGGASIQGTSVSAVGGYAGGTRFDKRGVHAGDALGGGATGVEGDAGKAGEARGGAVENFSGFAEAGEAFEGDVKLKRKT
jgi:hypothetical protein